MREDHEESILRNPAYLACLLWNLARSFSDNGSGRSPNLTHMVIGTSMLFHAASVEKIRAMKFDSGLLKALSDVPELVAGGQTRLEAALPTCLQALQLGVAAGIIRRESGDGLPTFLALRTNLPKALRDAEAATGPGISAARRLGAWFAREDLAIVRGRMGVRF
ncbi:MULTISPECIES: three component ABC system middle component [unclassified Rhizobium]|uniref:three component ABC system middle component n=1 Tax=unclassified Rhizobium TaxID=2613769 RepID=UPI0007EE460D|nr:hypothetical protein AMK07_PE00476 [Rhizobium sp. N941]